MKRNLLNYALLVSLLTIAFAVQAQLRLPHLVGDSMVLQRNQNINIWGWASAGEYVTVSINNKIYKTQAGPDKKWRILLPAMKEGGPYDMRIKAGNELTIKDILIGDVWLCSGQSNMEFQMSRIKAKYADDVANATNNNIRHFYVQQKYSFTPIDDVQGRWKPANPKNVLEFTAVGYFFAKALYEKYKIPVGLIHSSWGGTPAEAWTSDDGLKEFPQYAGKADYFKDTANLEATMQKDKTVTEDWFKQVAANDQGLLADKISWASPAYDATAWKTVNLPGFIESQGPGNVDGVIWLKKEVTIPKTAVGKDATLELGMIDDIDTTYFNGIKIGSSPNKYIPRRYTIPSSLLHEGKNVITVRVIDKEGNCGFIKDKLYQLKAGATEIDLAGEWQYKVGASVKPLPVNNFTILPYQPTAMYDGMLAPLIPYTIKGVIWYQGESNTGKPAEYQKLLPAMINDWRTKWGQGDFPFLIVQLANYMAVKEQPEESNWAALRESQSIVAAFVTNSGLAVTIDIGETNDVHPSAKKEVGERLALAAEKVAYGEKGLVYSGPTFYSAKITNNEIILSFTSVGSGLWAKGNAGLKQFAIAGADKKFVWASAKIEGNTIVVWNDSIANPVAVRYAWANNPEGCNLYNKEGLPASPFRTDNW